MAAATIEQKIIGHISGPPARTISHIQVTPRRTSGNSDAASYRRVTCAQGKPLTLSGHSDVRADGLKVGARRRAVLRGTISAGWGKEPGLRIELDCQGRDLHGRKKNPCDPVQILCELFW
jgi:hypothetical protein